ncbi:hypothetical protein [Lysobacter antibioticus]|nr:hypothetical protein [Lysobacter antibioticus]
MNRPKTMFMPGAAAMLMACATSPAIAASAEVDHARPEAVVEAAIACAKRQDFTCTARLMDPAALADFRRTLGPAFEESAGDPRLDGLFGADSAKRAKDMDDAEFLAQALSRVKRLGLVRIDSAAIVASATEGEAGYHAVVRIAGDFGWPESAATVVDLVSLRKVQGLWWLQPGLEAQVMIDGIKQARMRDLDRKAERTPGQAGD